MAKNVAVVISLIISIGAALYVMINKTAGDKTVYVHNQKLFEGFNGKKELEKKLKDLRAQNKKELDSLANIVQLHNNDAKLTAYYQQKQSDYQISEQQISATYTADIWKRINKYTVDFGKEKGYHFIFGATGDGNLMYAKDGLDVTPALIEYVNEKYEQGN